jgi:alpha-N-arabinofuranosidase
LDYDERTTPFHKPHSTEVAGLHDNPSGDDRYYNNVFSGSAGLNEYDRARLPVYLDGNVFLGEAAASRHEADPLQLPECEAAASVKEDGDGFVLAVDMDAAWTAGRRRQLVTTARLGLTAVAGLPYENADGTPVAIDRDYLGGQRDPNDPVPGPFERRAAGRVEARLERGEARHP